MRFFIAFVVAFFGVCSAFMPAQRMAQRMVSLQANIVETAVAAGTFNTLVAAVKAAGLVDALSAPGSITVFAPTDAAFAKLPAGTVDALLKDIPKLKNILLYHVVGSSVRPTRNGRTYETLLNGASGVPKELSVKVTVDTADSYIWGGQDAPALVSKMDVKADNGVIHIIDQVLLPYEGDVAPLHN